MKAAIAVGLWSVCVSSLAQTQSTALTVAGHGGTAPIIQRNGRSYVDVESLARVTGGTLGFQGNRIVLTLPTLHADTPVPAAEEPKPRPEDAGYSRDFLRAGVEQMIVIREWRSALENAIRTNNPVEESWISGYRRNADSRMQIAVASVTTNADRQAHPLLQGALQMVRQLSDRCLVLRSTFPYVSPDSLDNDPLDQKILACAQGLSTHALPGGKFEDVSACH